MIKRLLMVLITVVTGISASTQSISPVETLEFCPLQNITFTVTLPRVQANTVPTVASWTNTPILVSGIDPNAITHTPTQTICTFVGQFRDVNINQVFKIDFTPNGGSATSYLPSFKKIKSLFYPNPPGSGPNSPCQLLLANPTSITSPLCQITNHTIGVNSATKWSTYGEGNDFCWGTINDFEYQLPANWSIGGNTSNGSNWIAGGTSVTVTSDALNGENGVIRIRPRNTCATGLANNISPVIIQISRPVNLSISGANSFCTGSSTYTLNGLPPNSTVSWSVNNTNTATIPNPSTGTSVVVTKVSDGVVSLTATVTLCNGQSRTVSKNIVLGAYAFGTYQYTSNYSNGTNSLGSTNSHFIPANQTMSFMINLGNTDLTNITWTSTGSYSVNPVPNGFGGCSFYMVSAPTAYTSRTATLTINANGPCGAVNRSFNFTLITQGWGFRIQMNPNPATDNLIVSITDESTEVKALRQDETITMTLYDLNRTNIVKQWKFKNNQSRFNLNVGDVKMGHYVLLVQKGKYQQSEQIFIE
jgi:hypothetical protein